MKITRFVFASYILLLLISTQTVDVDKSVFANTVSYVNFSLPANNIPLPNPPKKYCPDEMVEINGDYCLLAQEQCLKWIDKDALYPRMCAKFAYPTKCVSKTERLHYCIDRYEAQTKKGEIPEVFINWFEAKNKCEASGKRLCELKELTLACEGPEMKPYPYGYVRDTSKCNTGHLWMDPDKIPFEKLDRRAKSGSFEDCKSDYGVYDIVGNVDEYSINPNGFMDHVPYISSLFGGHYVNGVRNRCRDQGVPSATTVHGPSAENYEMSYRCCKDIQ